MLRSLQIDYEIHYYMNYVTLQFGFFMVVEMDMVGCGNTGMRNCFYSLFRCMHYVRNVLKKYQFWTTPTHGPENYLEWLLIRWTLNL